MPAPEEASYKRRWWWWHYRLLLSMYPVLRKAIGARSPGCRWTAQSSGRLHAPADAPDAVQCTCNAPKMHQVHCTALHCETDAAALRDGRLYGGDLEVGALLGYLRHRNIRLRIKIWTSGASMPEVIAVQVHGDESKDKDVLEWQLAHFGYHYRVVEAAALEGLQQQSARAAPPGALRNPSWCNNFAILSDTSAWRAPLTTMCESISDVLQMMKATLYRTRRSKRSSRS